MKRWFLLAAVAVAFPVMALACGDDSAGGGVTPAATIDSGKTTPTSATTATTPPADAGVDAAHRTGCLDRPTEIERPDRLPCNLIPPGLTL